MDTFRKWWNKPKADDKSILARFYYADKALTAVASELDSFDGRAEPERCSRLVGRLRQGQDQVLAITNIIMDELLGDDRAPRAFRAKFPEEVLQESLAGQLWFGAECLAAGSSIMNREQESQQMRPLAKAVTKSLDHVRNLLRDQCLRNKTPNSLTLNLDLNDAVTETLCESLKIFDRLFAEFELLYVSAMVQVKSKQEHEMQELICVLFSETLQRALRIGLLEQEQVDSYDPALMFSIPRLAIVAGLVIYNKGPLNMSMPADQLSEMFRPFRTLLIKIRELLKTLNANELYQLEKLLCTNEDIHIIESPPAPTVKPAIKATKYSDANSTSEVGNFNCDDSDEVDDDEEEEEKFIESNSSASSTSSASNTSTVSGTSSNISRCSTSNGSNSTLEIPSSNSSASDVDRNVIDNDVYCTINDNANIPSNSNANAGSEAIAAGYRVNVWTNAPISITTASSGSSGATSTTLLGDSITTDPESSTHPNKHEWITTECASGYLIPNTNFGNLLQTTDTPLTDSFISSDDEYTQKSEKNLTNAADMNGGDSLFVVNSSASNNLDSEPNTNIATIQSMISNVRVCANEPTNLQQTITTISTGDGDLCRVGHYKMMNNNGDSGIGTAENTSLDHTPDSETNRLVVSTSGSDVTVSISNAITQPNAAERGERVDVNQNGMNTAPNPNTNANIFYQTYSTPAYYSTTSDNINDMAAPDTLHQRSHHKLYQSSRHSHSQHSRREKCERKGCMRKHQLHSGNHSSSSKSHNSSSRRHRSSRHSSLREIEEKVSISSTSCIYSEGDPQDVWRNSGRIKFKSTENLLHRLFVCIAGVADQLQTNFASDLRQILRSVFLMNTSPLEEEEVEVNVSEKSKDSTSDLFEFRASENDVIQENDGGSNQSIYSAEEANPETDSVFEQSIGQTTPTTTAAMSSIDRQERSASLETEIRITTNRVNIERSHSVGEATNARPVSLVVTTTNQIQCVENNNGNNNNDGSNYHHPMGITTSNRSDNNNPTVISNSDSINNNSMTNNTQSSSSNENSSTMATTTTTIILTTNNRLHRNSLNDEHQVQTPPPYQHATNQSNTLNSRQQQIITETPPRWIPDEEAAQCMACAQTFTTFRRRHHCRNCGGVFCGICSNSQAPLPKFGLTKAVRVCRNCFSMNFTQNGTAQHM